MLALVVALVGAAHAAGFMEAAPPGQTETGVPAFAVFGAEAIGFQQVVTGLHLLPDGRVLVTSPGELAFSDGVRWQVFRAAAGEPMLPRQALVDESGAIYFALPGSLGRVEFGSDGTWQTRPVTQLPDLLHRDTLSNAMTAGGEWYWFGGGGSFVQWRPGREPVVISNRTTIERLFTVGSELYASEQTSGGLFCISRNGERVTAKDRITSAVVTAAVAFDERTTLVATMASGLQLFDGKRFWDFGASTIFRGLRTTDLCAVGPDQFAAAIDTRGIVFFDRAGHVLQTLDAKLDHRLARVQSLRYSPDGTLWAVLEEGVARVQYPARVSRFEPLVTAGLSYVAPFRHAGRLWLLAEGHALKAEYDAANCLDRFVPDNPPGSFVFTLSAVAGELFAGTDTGIYVRRGEGWQTVVTGIVNARVGVDTKPNGDIVYAARGEIGLLQKTGDRYAVQRTPVEKLGDNYGSRVDGAGIVWLELGAEGVGRMDVSGGAPRITLYGADSGLRQGWDSVFILEGVPRVDISAHVYRFDEGRGRFVEDDAFAARLPLVAKSTTVPMVGPDGRVWYSDGGRTWTMNPSQPNAAPQPIDVPFTAMEYTFEQDGVVWLRGDRRFARYDPAVRASASSDWHVEITSIQFPNSNRELFGMSAGEPIPYSDNTILFHFAAPGNAFDPSTSFQVQLEGANSRWEPAGNTGQAIFNRLKEGRYVFRVRAVTAGGSATKPAEVAFVISHPWFRSGIAWLAYIGSGVGLLIFSTWYPVQRQKREKARLESLVAKRTEELNRTNRRLERQIEETTEKSQALLASEERYRSLNADLEHRVADRTAQLSISNQELREAQEKLATTYRELLSTSRMAGMAEVATSVLHNVGNVLNSLNVSANLIGAKIRTSRVESLKKVVVLLQEHAADLGAFLSADPKGRLIPKLLEQLADTGMSERDWLVQEIASLQKNIDHIKEIVTMQQSYATMLGVTETLPAASLFEDAIRMNAGALTRHEVRLVREFEPVPDVCVEKGKVLQILVNLIRNAKYACDEGQAYGAHEKIVVLRLESSDGNVRFIVRDNGVGIPPENLTKIFAHGFTTRAHGHGFGLHSSVLAAKEMKGTLTAASDGIGKGATFTLELPIASDGGATAAAPGPALG